MFITPYMRKILNSLSRIWEGHEDDFFWEPSGALADLNRRLSAELRKCQSDWNYANENYLTGPADEWTV